MTQEHAYKHVLVALDINDNFQPILNKAIAIARRHEAKLVITSYSIHYTKLYEFHIDIDHFGIEIA